MFIGMRALLNCLVVFGLFLSTPALAADVDDLKATYEKAVKAYNSRDDAWYATFDDKAVSFHPTAPFAIDGDAHNKQVIKSFWGTVDSTVFSPVNPKYRVIGSTGIVWGHYAFANKPKDGGMRTSYGRFTTIYTKSDGKWLAVSSHYSAIPSGN
jgi:ketosteroid isomerase-like protein